MPYDRQRELHGQYQRHTQCINHNFISQRYHDEIYDNYVIAYANYEQKHYITIKLECKYTYFTCYHCNNDNCEESIINYNEYLVEYINDAEFKLSVRPDNITIYDNVTVKSNIFDVQNNAISINNVYYVNKYNGSNINNVYIIISFIDIFIEIFDVGINNNTTYY